MATEQAKNQPSQDELLFSINALLYNIDSKLKVFLVIVVIGFVIQTYAVLR